MHTQQTIFDFFLEQNSLGLRIYGFKTSNIKSVRRKGRPVPISNIQSNYYIQGREHQSPYMDQASVPSSLNIPFPAGHPPFHSAA